MESSTGESGSPTSSSEYETVWSSPPKRPADRTKVRETRHPVYRGVRRRGHSDRWICEVRDHNTRSRIWIGTFPTAEMAARAHDVAAIALRGTAACLNFTDSAWLINVPSSFSSVQELKRVAIKMANTLHGVADEKKESGVSSTTTSRISYDTEVVSNCNSSIFNVGTSDSDRFDRIEFELDVNGEMDPGLYYASLAEALLMEPPVMEPPVGSYGSCDEDEESTVMSLWSYIV